MMMMASMPAVATSGKEEDEVEERKKEAGTVHQPHG
jgi:hypothetical protein